MPERSPELPGRREVLTGAALLTLAGCLPSRVEPAPPDPELRVRARIAEEVRVLARQYEAVLERFPAAGRRLEALAVEHEDHALALLARSDRARPGGAAGAAAVPTPSHGTSTAHSGAAETAPSSGPSPREVPAVPATLPAALRSLAAAERTAATRRARQARRASPVLARLLASIAGCEAGHAVLLEVGPRGP
jgi:hypothetical protein